jgi:arsenate reductase-like glutaredoxin family protein
MEEAKRENKKEEHNQPAILSFSNVFSQIAFSAREVKNKTFKKPKIVKLGKEQMFLVEEYFSKHPEAWKKVNKEYSIKDLSKSNYIIKTPVATLKVVLMDCDNWSEVI